MRDHLQALAAAGIRRARFSARAAGISPRGHVILEDLASPVGDSQHCWVDPADTKELPPLGRVASFIATIQPYERDDPSIDYALTNIRLLEGC